MNEYPAGTQKAPPKISPPLPGAFSPLALAWSETKMEEKIMAKRFFSTNCRRAALRQPKATEVMPIRVARPEFRQ